MNLRDLPQHHTVLVVSGDRQTLSGHFWKELGESSASVHTYVQQSVLDIDTARNLITWATSPNQEEKVAIVSFHTATIPAQNAMLKILEEPRAGVRFVLCTSHKEGLLDTVISRTWVIHEKESQESVEDLARLFLKEKPVARMKLKAINELLAQEDEEGRKDRESIRSFILSLVQVLSQEKTLPKKYIEETLRMASYAGDPSTSGKLIVEYLSLLLPKCGTIA